ncbi:MAG: hypothetical protein Q4D38_00940 [Planctomycetia bacterium]|nr:hypothetical protein [Planctomycetia bacterium]
MRKKNLTLLSALAVVCVSVWSVSAQEFELPGLDFPPLEDVAQTESVPAQEEAPLVEGTEVLDQLGELDDSDFIEMELPEIELPSDVDVAQAPGDAAVEADADLGAVEPAMDAPNTLPAVDLPTPEPAAPVAPLATPELLPAATPEAAPEPVVMAPVLAPEEPAAQNKLPSSLPPVPAAAAAPQSILQTQPTTPVAPSITQPRPTNELDTSVVVDANSNANVAARPVAGVYGAPRRDCDRRGFQPCPRPTGPVPVYPRRAPRMGWGPAHRAPMFDPYYTIRGPRDFVDPNMRPIQ